MKRSALCQGGFTLIELMTVVMITGVLAAMSAGSLQKAVAKARQAEAKINLAGLYTAEQLVKIELGSYTSDFNVMKLEPVGKIRYRFGFGADHRGAAVIPGQQYYGMAGVEAIYATGRGSDFSGQDVIVLGAICGQNDGGAAVIIPGMPVVDPIIYKCTETAEARGVELNGTSVTQSTFTGAAASFAVGNILQDTFTIDQNKNIIHTEDGIM